VDGFEVVVVEFSHDRPLVEFTHPDMCRAFLEAPQLLRVRGSVRLSSGDQLVP
jgi:hypothetical protein